MRELGLSGVTASRRRPRTPLPDQDRPVDLLERDFTADAPNLRWVVGITYVATAAGWVYAAFVQDLFSRRIVGWQVADHLGADLALDALEMAIWARGGSVDGLVHHSDRGVHDLDRDRSTRDECPYPGRRRMCRGPRARRPTGRAVRAVHR